MYSQMIDVPKVSRKFSEFSLKYVFDKWTVIDGLVALDFLYWQMCKLEK